MISEIFSDRLARSGDGKFGLRDEKLVQSTSRKPTVRVPWTVWSFYVVYKH